MRIPHIFRHRHGGLSALRIILLCLLVGAASWSVCIYSQLGALQQLPLLSFTGFPGSAHYLVIFQNDAERRPTGGFITKYAILSFHFGLPYLSFGDVYEPPLIQAGTLPPDPFIARLLIGEQYPGHGFRDGNTDPDFPTSSRELIRLYHLGYPSTPIDGVISIDFTAFGQLLSGSGALPSIATIDGRFRPDLLFTALESQVQDIDTHSRDDLVNRKNILSSLARSLILHLVLHPGSMQNFADSAAAMLDQKHLQLFSTSSPLQARFAALHWDGALPDPEGGDYLGLIEGNYGGLKNSRYLITTATYQVNFSYDANARTWTPHATFQADIEHHGTYNEPISGYYKSLWRLYVPSGIQHVTGTLDSAYTDGKRQIWTRFIDMQPGESRSLSYAYDLPSSIVQNHHYRLTLPRQSGGDGLPLRVTLTLPAGYYFSESSNIPSGIHATDHLAVWQGVLTHDTIIDLDILPDTTPPRVARQNFIHGLHDIELHYNKPLNSSSITPSNLSITDKNHRDSHTDTVQITSAYLTDPQTIHLTVTGISPTCKEWYTVHMQNIADTQGNTITNKDVTVVSTLTSAGTECDPQGALQ